MGVYFGKKVKTVGGLTKSDLTKNKHGRIVSKRLSAKSQRSKFPKVMIAARKALNIKGFCPIGGKTAKGQALLKKARSLYKKLAAITGTFVVRQIKFSKNVIFFSKQTPSYDRDLKASDVGVFPHASLRDR